MRSRKHASRWQTLVPLVLMVMASGCATLDPGTADVGKLPELGADGGQSLAQRPEGMIMLEVRAANDRSETRQIPLTQSMHIQDAIEQAGLTKRFKRMDLYVMRVTGDQRNKLESKYSYKSGIVNPLYDYSLRPGDHLVVIEDTNNLLDDMLESLAGPMGPAFRR